MTILKHQKCLVMSVPEQKKQLQKNIPLSIDEINQLNF